MRSAVSATICTLLLCGCRGVASSGLVPASGTGMAAFTVSIPKSDGSVPSMQSLGVTLDQVNGRAPASAAASFKMNFSTKTRGCSALADGSLTCTAKFAAPAGTDSFTVVIYALPNQGGARVYINRVTTRISAGSTTTCVKRS